MFSFPSSSIFLLIFVYNLPNFGLCRWNLLGLVTLNISNIIFDQYSLTRKDNQFFFFKQKKKEENSLFCFAYGIERSRPSYDAIFSKVRADDDEHHPKS